MTDGEWHLDDFRCWNLHRGNAHCWIAPRPHYCDRGHWVANVSGIPTIDGQDCFPRYFMDIDRAKAEMAAWLDWRLAREGER